MTVRRPLRPSKSHLLRLVVAAGVLAAGFLALRGYTTDDTYIHLRYAENLLERGEFAFNPGVLTYGATSPLWVLGLAALLALGVPPSTAPALLGLMAAAGALLLFDAILTRLPFRSSWKFWLLLLAAADVWFLRWARSGMETPLSGLVLLLLLWPLVAERLPGGWLAVDPGRPAGQGPPLWHRYLAWGVASGLAALVRPEFLLMAPLALPWLLWFEYYRASDAGGRPGRLRARPHRLVVAAVAGWLLAAGPWLVYARLAFGRWLPGTVAAKSGDVGLDLQAVIAVVARALVQLGAVQAPLWAGLGLVAIAALVIRRQPADVVSGRNQGSLETLLEPPPPRTGRADTGLWTIWLAVALVGVAFTWTGVLVVGYALKQVWVISRYVAPLTAPLLLALGVLGVWLADSLGATPRRARLGQMPLLAGAVLAVALNAYLMITQVVPHARRFPAGLEACYLETGRWLRENTPPDVVVAALDIGGIGYASDRHILDLMGLVSPEILTLGREMGFEELVATGAWLHVRSPSGRRPDYLVDRTSGPPRWQGQKLRGVTFELLDTCVIEGVGLTESQPWTVALYRLRR
ncbi:MAG: hypothetical protein R6X25_16050 [Candidatus Krumholzibacteriia bacterium]